MENFGLIYFNLIFWWILKLKKKSRIQKTQIRKFLIFKLTKISKKYKMKKKIMINFIGLKGKISFIVHLKLCKIFWRSKNLWKSFFFYNLSCDLLKSINQSKNKVILLIKKKKLIALRCQIFDVIFQYSVHF